MSPARASSFAPEPFTPALGHSRLTGVYDLAIRLLTRESAWRSALLDQVAPQSCETIIDVGCGTGSFAILMKQKAPCARIIGLDPDPEVLGRAAAKATKAGVDIEWRQGFASDVANFGERFDKAVSSLVFHQVPIAGKQSGLAAMAAALRPGGELHIADYARQPSVAMRALFRLTVQRLDGVADTQPNVDGAIEAILAGLSRSPATPQCMIQTPTGAISLFRIITPGLV